MSDNVHKFIFLGVVVLVTTVTRQNAFVQNSTQQVRSASEGIAAASSPFFTFFSPSPHRSSTIPSLGEVASSITAIARGGDAPTSSGTESLETPALTAQQPSEAVAHAGNDGAFAATLYPDASPTSLSFNRIGNETPPAIGAQAAVLLDIQTGDRFFSLNPNKRWPLASLTKMMTAATALRVLQQSESTTITSADLVSGNENTGVRQDERYRVKDLLSIMLLLSSNEAAEALANLYGRAPFIATMNTQATSWGLRDTYFDDPTGLSASNQSSIRDLQNLVGQFWGQYPQLFSITRTARLSITELNSGVGRLVSNINQFAGRSDFLGGKTGYTDEASGNLISLFSYHGRPVLIIVLGTSDRFGDTEKLLAWFERNFR